MSTRGRVLIVVGDATETLDTMYPYYRLWRRVFSLLWQRLSSSVTRWYCMR